MSNSKTTKKTNDDNQDQQFEQSYESEQSIQLFMNVAPVVNKNSKNSSVQKQDKFLQAKIKRLIGTTSKSAPVPINVQKPKICKVSKLVQKVSPCIQQRKISNQPQVQFPIKQTNSTPLKSKKDQKKQKKISKCLQNTQSDLQQGQMEFIQKDIQAAFFGFDRIQKKCSAVDLEMDLQRLQKFAQIQRELLLPINELVYLSRDPQQQREQKRQKKRQQRKNQKKQRQYRQGKVRDQVSNSVFNGIEDYFK